MNNLDRPSAPYEHPVQQRNAPRSQVNWKTRDGTAVSPEDYIAAEGELVFKPGEHTQQIDIVGLGTLRGAVVFA